MGVVVPIQPAPAASVKPLIALTAADMARVNALILSKAGSNVKLIPEIANHLVNSGGKRLRPMLTCAAAGLFGYRGEGHIKLACAVEFMHTATLLHDDVVDESDLRRTAPTARTIWGNQASVLVGDFLLGQAFRMMVDVGVMDALDILSSASAVIAEGEVLQLSVAKRMETTETDYLNVIGAKTAALFAAACEVGPVIAGAGNEERTALRDYGHHLGVAFQLIDDALDYGGTTDAMGKNTGDDFREGKITLPVILAHRRGTPEEREFWRSAMEGGQTDDDALAYARTLLAKHDTLSDTIARARHYGGMARDALAPVPNGPHKDALLEVIEYCITRAS